MDCSLIRLLVDTSAVDLDALHEGHPDYYCFNPAEAGWYESLGICKGDCSRYQNDDLSKANAEKTRFPHSAIFPICTKEMPKDRPCAVVKK